MSLHQRINSSRLVALLQQWAQEDDERQDPPGRHGRPGPDLAERLSHWLGTVDAVKLSRALHTIETLPRAAGLEDLQEVPPLDVHALDCMVERARASLAALISGKAAAPRPTRARADHTPVQAPDPLIDAEFGPHGSRFLELQRQIETRLAALRVQMRHALAHGTCALRQLAAMDAVMEQLLAAQEERLWASLPLYLERRLAHWKRKHQQALLNSGNTDEPMRWRDPGGWLWAFEQDVQALLLAQMQVRLQPITGLLEAARNKNSGPME